MRVIGLTGGIASGKSTVSAHLAALGACIVDADAVARQLQQPGTEAVRAIAAQFGEEYAPQGVLDRKKMGALVFADPSARAKLEAIMLPRILAECGRQIEAARAAGETCAVLDAPTLIESGAYKMVDEIWLVTVPQSVQLARLMARNGFTREEAQSRISSQMPQDEKARYAHVLIDNGGTQAETLAQVDALWRALG